ncbi:MAG: helix-turn-helix domain-containing protein [Deltaproteobacteria bacterium]|nr:helix-turn-helix domain-containing protein [Deltaproteobacteria bacterium]
MQLDPERCWRAAMAHDRRFDGRFFIGVVTTGVYCRPICSVSPPRRRNVRFYASAAGAEEAGFRPCRRCRPETAPGTPAWLGSSTTVSRALRLISEGALDEHGVDELAGRLGIGSRQLRRLFAEHLGALPLSVARTRRIHFARRMLDQTELPMSQVALSSGFRSVRSFNQALRETFGRTPTQLRRQGTRRRRSSVGGEITLRLPYRPPYDWDGVLAFLTPRAIPGVECVVDGSYQRLVEIDGSIGVMRVAAALDSCELVLALQLDDPGGLLPAVRRTRRLFDLGADPLQIETDLRGDRELARRIDARPGVRVPGAWDPFEVAVRAILGQQVTVKGATTLAGRLVRSFGKPVERADALPLTHLFPSPETLAEADVASIGMPRQRAQALRALAAAVADGRLPLDGALELDPIVAKLRELPGVGEWTAHYIALRALGEPDAFPAGDLGLRKALGRRGEPMSAARLRARAERWRPWRAYAAMWLWLGDSAA